MNKNFEHLIELMKAFDKSDSTFLSYTDKDLEIKLKKSNESENKKPQSIEKKFESISESISESNDKAIDVLENENNIEVKSPLVGVFYEAKEPGAKPFVHVGKEVKTGDVLCILESMKMMNEIKSPIDGKVLEIRCENESVVEYNQILFILEESNA